MVNKVSNDIWNDIDFSSESNSNLQEIILSYIKKLILSGSLKNGDKLPSQRELAQYVGVSLQTISRVIEGLIEDGYIYTISRKGAFVTEKYIEKNIHMPLAKKDNDSYINNLSTNSPAIINSLNECLKLKSFKLFKEINENQQRTYIKDFFLSYVHPRHINQNSFLTYGAYQAIFISLLFLKIKYKKLIIFCEKITFTPIVKICNSLKIQVLHINNFCFSCGEAIENINSIKNKMQDRKYAIYTMNPLHNPMLYTHNKSEMVMISNYIIKNNMIIIEDSSYFFAYGNYTSFYHFAPNNTFTILSTSKFLPSMLRLGMLYPPHNIDIELLTSICSSIS